MNDATIKRIFNLYGLEITKLYKPEKGYRNYCYPAKSSDGSMNNLIVYKADADILKRIKLANKVSDFLSQNNFPARQTVDNKILRLKTAGGTRYAALYSYIPGATISWEAYTRSRLKLLGAEMARMHSLLEDFPVLELEPVENEYMKLIRRMRHYFSQPAVNDSILQKLNCRLNLKRLVLYEYSLEAAAKLPRRQALHMDFVRSNILFNTSAATPKINGVIDFEKAACGPIIFDISRTLSFLYVDCKYKSPQTVKKAFLASGYIKLGGGDFGNYFSVSGSRQIFLLDSLTEMFWMHDFYKFLKHNPYEDLAANQHFVRTKRFLITQGAVAAAANK